MSVISLTTPVSELNCVGKTAAGRLKHLGLATVQDLIFYFPFRYDDFSQISDIGALSVGQIVTVRGRVEMLAGRRTSRQKKFLTEALVSDGTGAIKVLWFNQPWIAKSLRVGEEIFLSGKVAGDMFNLYFSSPSYEKARGAAVNAACLAPVYYLTESLSQKQIRFLIKIVLPLAEIMEDFLPEDVRREQNLMPLAEALRAIHFQADSAAMKKARERLAFDEIFLLQLWSGLARRKMDQQKAPVIDFFLEPTRVLTRSFGFTLTMDQKKAAWEIIKDIGRPRPMNRLLEGDVGSGKTAVAALAIYNAALAGYQSALIAPTEILAAQHFRTILKFLGGAAAVGAITKAGQATEKNTSLINVGLLTRTQKIIGSQAVSQKEFLAALASGELPVVIGTHAVIQEKVIFKNLGLVIIDEQHRFGVKQRQALTQKTSASEIKNSAGKAKKSAGETDKDVKNSYAALAPHFLSLTATPIPRSLALTIYGDLDLSVIKSKPADRLPIITRLATPDKRQLAYEFMAKQVAAGRQVFVVCPLIDPSDKLGSRSVKQEFEKLDQEVFPLMKIGLLHGRLPAAEKEKVMADFVSGGIKILVATSVIEVGVDVPNASVMMIEGAERFGLAQLHQFRGRVGRSAHQSYCFLFTDKNEPMILERLSALVSSQDGFALAEKDLAWRGAGKIYGYEQSGFGDLKIADLQDAVLIKKARLAARKILGAGSSAAEILTAPDKKDILAAYPLLREKLAELKLGDHLE